MLARGRLTRRDWLLGTLAAGLSVRQLALNAQAASKTSFSKLAMPGLFPGRVVAVSHPACIVDGRFQAAPIAPVLHAACWS